MAAVDLLFEGLQLVMREASLFAAVGFLILGISDLGIDAAWLILAARRRLNRRDGIRAADQVPPPARPGAMAVFVPAWDEAAVIGDMLGHAVAAFGDADYRLYVGCYPNDPETIAAVRAMDDARIRLVVGPGAGPTSKAECLNRIWDRMTADEAAGIM
jgi:adsorption protein B